MGAGNDRPLRTAQHEVPPVFVHRLGGERAARWGMVAGVNQRLRPAHPRDDGIERT